MMIVVATLSALLLLIALFFLAGINIVDQWARRPVMRLGRYHRTLGPGITWINPFVCRTLDDVSIRENVERLTLVNVQTHDNVRVKLQLTLTWIVGADDVEKLTLSVENALGDDVEDDEDDEGGTEHQQGAMQRKVIAAMMDVLGRSSLDRVLSSRVDVCQEARRALTTSIAHWGIDILALEISDFAIADESIERAIAMKARAEKEAQAELKRAEMQEQIVTHLNAAAKKLDADGWRLKTLETLIELCRSANNNTILLPADLAQFAHALTATSTVA